MSIQLIICLFDPYVVCSWNTEVEVVRKNFIGQDGRGHWGSSRREPGPTCDQMTLDRLLYFG